MAPSSPHPQPEWLWDRLRAFDRRYATLVDVAVAAALFVLSTGWVVERAHQQPRLWFAAGLTIPLVFRRRAPMTVFLVVSAVALVQWSVSVPGLADLALLVALATVALESDWLLVLIAAAVVEVGVVMATVRWTPTGNHVKSFVFLTGLALAALLGGLVVRALRSQLDWLAERTQRLEIERDQQASLAAAAERARIAREMHDVVSHNLQVMVTLADAAAAQARDPERAAEVMHEVSSTGRQALADMRRMLGVLREDETVHAGTDGGAPDGSTAAPLAPQPGLGQLDALVERVRGTGLDVALARHGSPFAVSDAAGLSVYRIVQEALTNALKHAEDPQRVEVRLDFDDPDVCVRVTDDGRARGGSEEVPASRGKVMVAGSSNNGHGRGGGVNAGVGTTAGVDAAGQPPGLVDPGGHHAPSGHGVTGMAERAAAFGGTLEAGPLPAGGWEVRAVLRDCKAPAGA